MAKARCPECDTLVGISPTGERIHPDWPSRWWLVDIHKHPSEAKLCDGGGKRV